MSAAVDAGLARALAALIGPEPTDPGPSRAQVVEAISEAARAASSFAELGPASVIPAPRTVDRAGWVDSNLASLDALAGKMRTRLEAPGPIAGAAERLFSLAAGAQAGAVLGYASTRVLGQYRVPLLGEEVEPQLLIVATNLGSAAERLDVDATDLLLWVAVHEVTHVLQFDAAGWLPGHLGELIDEVLARARPQLGTAELRRLAGLMIPPDPRRLLGALRELEPVELLSGPEGREAFGRLQAAMSLLEGHAEHVMDAASSELVPDVASLRRKLERRRADLGPVAAVVAKLLGLETKARQYREGRSFVDAVVEGAGLAALNRAFEGPANLPSARELAEPELWLRRAAPAGASARR